jgi:hypothetical protein
METTQTALVNRAVLIERYSRLLARLARNDYKCRFRFQDDLTKPEQFLGIVIATIAFDDIGFTAAEMLSLDPLLVEEPAFVDVAVEALIVGQLVRCGELIASLPPSVWASVRSQAPRAGYRLLHDGSGVEVCFSAILIARAIDNEMQAIAAEAV